MIDQEWLQSANPMEPCIRCRAKGVVVCPECQGTGEKRNDSYVVTGRCGNCEKVVKGFITCPSCLGEKAVQAGQLRANFRREAERLRSIPAVWGFVIAAAPARRAVLRLTPPGVEAPDLPLHSLNPGRFECPRAVMEWGPP